MNGNNVLYFGIFRVEHIPKEIRKFAGNKNITTNMYRTQANNLLMCGYFCIGFINVLLKDRSFLDYT